jgi:hypothetical protein
MPVLAGLPIVDANDPETWPGPFREFIDTLAGDARLIDP